MKNKLIKVLAGILVVGILAWIIVVRCSEDTGSRDSENIESEITPVRVMELNPGRVEWGVSVVGIIMPDKGVDILSEVNGKVKKVYFNVGDNVKKGKILVKIDDEYKNYDLIRAEAQYESARADLEKSELDLKRYQELYKTNDVSEYELENIRLKKVVSRANFLTAESMYKTAKRQFEDTKIKSPFSGFTSRKAVEEGNMVAVGTPVARVIDIQEVKLNVEVAEKDISHIEVGNLVRISVDAYSNREFTGKVAAVSPEADMKTKTFPIEIKVKNTSDFKLKPGMVAKGKIITEITENTFLLPQDVIIEKDGIHFVFLNEGDKAVKNIVKVGRNYNNLIEVTEGLNSNDKVVISGSEFLSDGARIQIQN